MNDEGNKLLESLMGALGDNPSETIGQMMSALSEKTSEKKEDDGAESPQEGESAGFDPSILLKLQGLMGNQNQSDERSTLLQALRPFLSEDKKPQLDRAIKFLQLSQLAKTAQELKLFNNLL